MSYNGEGLAHPAQWRALRASLGDKYDDETMREIIAAWKSDEVQRDYFHFFTPEEEQDNISAFQEIVHQAAEVFDRGSSNG
jgi:hypothetical protein